MRKLFFQNRSGERVDLNSRTLLASDLSGFGVSYAPVYADLGSGFFAAVETTLFPQPSLGFTLNFVGAQAYADYRSLVSWLAAAGDLVLVYIPYGDEEYLCRVDIAQIDKAELNKLGWLVSPCEFKALSPWYRTVTTSVDMVTESAEAVRYPYSYTAELRFGAETMAEFQATLYPGGQQPAGFVLKYVGAISNPVIRLEGVSTGKTYAVCALNYQFGAADVLEFSTLPDDNHIRCLTPTGEQIDLIDKVNPTVEPFAQLPLNEACAVSIESSSLFAGTASVDVYYYYRTV